MELVGKIYRTTDYKKFKRLVGNRKIDQAKIKKIIKSIKEVGYIMSPLIVNEKMEIIDGQHRLEALIQLGMPVDFIIVDGAGVNECIALNINQTSWTLIDYIESYAETGSVSYMYLLQLIRAYGKKLQNKVILNVAAGKVENNTKLIKDGGFVCTIEDYNHAVKVLSYLLNFRSFIGRVKGHIEYYYMALAFCYDLEEINNDRMVKKFENLQANLIPVTTILQAFEVVEEIYNNRSKDRVYLKTIYRQHMDEKYGWYSGKYGNRY